MSQEIDKIEIHIFFFLLWEWRRNHQKIIRRVGDGFVLENKHQLKIRKGMEEIKPPECKRVGDLHLQNHTSSVLIINPPHFFLHICVYLLMVLFLWKTLMSQLSLEYLSILNNNFSRHKTKELDQLTLNSFVARISVSYNLRSFFQRYESLNELHSISIVDHLWYNF